jgi:uncharacterized lipoprotein YajG
MMKYLVIFCSAIWLSACATAAKVDSMIGTPTVQMPAMSPLKGSVQVTNVSGGRDTNPLWTSQVGNGDFQQALEKSLSAQGILASGDAKYRLEAALVELKQPLLGLDMKVTSTVRYRVTEVSTGRMAFDQTITADYTATVGDAFVAVERLRLANEGSIKTNLSKFLDQLIGNLGNGGVALNALKVEIVS